MPRILPFKDPEPEEINGFKDITEAVNFLDIIIQYSDGRTEMGCFKCEACAWRRTIRYIAQLLFP